MIWGLMVWVSFRVRGGRMAMWLRLGAALLVTLVAILALEFLGAGNPLADRSPARSRRLRTAGPVNSSGS
jgi:hypothetical protein